jgi:hypothetical protein
MKPCFFNKILHLFLPALADNTISTSFRSKSMKNTNETSGDGDDGEYTKNKRGRKNMLPFCHPKEKVVEKYQE